MIQIIKTDNNHQ